MLFEVRLNTIDKVKEFNEICNQYDFDIDVISGKYVVNGKSILGLLSLDLTKKLIVRIDNKDLNKLVLKVKKFIDIH